MALVSYRPLRTNSTDLVSGYNGTDTSITYASVGPLGGAAGYNSNTDRITVATQTAFNVSTGSVAMRLSATTAGYFNIICKNNNTGPNDNFFVAVGPNSSNGKFSAFTGAAWDDASVVNDGKWYYVEVTSTAGDVDMYVNGNLVTSVSGNIWLNTGNGAPLYIGYRAFDPGASYADYISGVAFYNHKRANAEVKNTYSLYKGFI